MKDLKQEIIKFNYDENFNNDDFYISNSNKHIFDLINKWPKWEKNFLNISGEKFSGKTHLINIFIKKICHFFSNNFIIRQWTKSKFCNG